MKFFSLVSFAALIAIAVAAPGIKNAGRTIEVGGKDVVFNVEDGTHSVTTLNEGVKGLSTKLAEKLEIMTAIDDGLKARVAGLREDTDNLKDSVATNFANFKAESTATHESMVKAFAEGLDSLKTQTTNLRETMKADYGNKFTQFDNSVKALSSKVTEKLGGVESRANNKATAATNDYNSKISAATSRIGTATVRADKIVQDLKTKRDGHQIVWIGGMRGHMYSGWRIMNFDRTDLDAKGAHFEVKGNYFLVKKAGIYRLCLWTIQHGIGGFRYMVRINGNQMMNTGHREGGDAWRGRGPSWRNYWEDMHIDQTWHFKANERVDVRMYSPQYSLHGGTNRHSYNRISFTFLGENSVSLRM